MSLEPKKNNTKWLIIGGIAAVLVVVLAIIAVIALSIMNSPKVLANTLIDRTPKALMEVYNIEGLAAMQEQSALQKLIAEEPHESSTVAELDLGYMAPEIELNTAYVNETGEGQIAFSVDAGGGDAVAGGVYLDGAEIAFVIEDLMDDAVVIDMDKDIDPANKTLEERFTELFSGTGDMDPEELQKYVLPVTKKLDAYLTKFAQELPSEAWDKDSEELDLLGESTKVKYVSITMDDKDFTDAMEVILEEMIDDSDFEDALVDLFDYIESTPSGEAMLEEMYFDSGDIDIEDIAEEMLDNLDYTEFDELTIKIYYIGRNPIGYGVVYEDDWSEVDSVVTFYSDRKGDQVTMMIDAGEDGGLDAGLVTMSEMVHAYFTFEDYGDTLEFDLLAEQTSKDTWEVEGTLESYDGEEMELTGELVTDGDTTTGEFEFSYTDYWGDTFGAEAEIVIEETKKDNYSIEGEATVMSYGDTADIDFSMTVASSNDGLDSEVEGEFNLSTDYESFSADFTFSSEEVRKNREYAGEAEIVIRVDGEKVGVALETELIFGSEAEADLPNWSDSDYIYSINDMDDLEELLDELSWYF